MKIQKCYKYFGLINNISNPRLRPSKSTLESIIKIDEKNEETFELIRKSTKHGPKSMKKRRWNDVGVGTRQMGGVRKSRRIEKNTIRKNKKKWHPQT